jgi:hypothetical protein
VSQEFGQGRNPETLARNDRMAIASVLIILGMVALAGIVLSVAWWGR